MPRVALPLFLLLSLASSTIGAYTQEPIRGLSLGRGGTSGSATALYFSAGSDGEQHGLFGTITPRENMLGNSQ
jgi:hypothetical protein